ncbi:hypothetical protein, partial [Vibrio fortis]|uniref:hypothetical protein n=1 Tax=Vibrio fortis TaxID=212667 RepID=UPI0036F21351
RIIVFDGAGRGLRADCQRERFIAFKNAIFCTRYRHGEVRHVRWYGDQACRRIVRHAVAERHIAVVGAIRFVISQAERVRLCRVGRIA